MLTSLTLIIFSLSSLSFGASLVSFGPLLKELAPFEIDHHLPTFPIPFTLPLRNSKESATRYLYFPGEDSAADRDSSIMRCRALQGELYNANNANNAKDTVEREMMACIIGSAIHMSKEKEADGDCWVMLPGGTMANQKDFCKRHFGSVCKLH